MNLTVIPLTSRKKTEKFCFFDELKQKKLQKNSILTKNLWKLFIENQIKS